MFFCHKQYIDLSKKKKNNHSQSHELKVATVNVLMSFQSFHTNNYFIKLSYHVVHAIENQRVVYSIPKMKVSPQQITQYGLEMERQRVETNIKKDGF